MRMVRGMAIAAALLLTTSGCSRSSSQGGKPRVLAAFYPLEEVARHVGGDDVEVANITPPGAEPHDIELRPADVVAIREADLVLYFGGGFQPAIERALRPVARSKKVDVLTSMPGLRGDDPHVWLSPPLMRSMTDVISASLASLLPSASRAALESRSTALKHRLEELDGAFRHGLSSCRRRDLVTSHDAFGYLAAEYDLKPVPIAGLDPDSEPSPQRIQEVAAQARRVGATTIFFETVLSPRLSEAVARIAGAKTAALDPLESVSRKDRESGMNYFSIMAQNLASLRTALGCGT